MATLDFRLTEVPQDLAAALGFSEGSTVVLQNVDRTATAFFRESDTAPASDAKGFQVPPFGSYQIQVSATPVWAWTTDAAGCQIVLNLVR